MDFVKIVGTLLICTVTALVMKRLGSPLHTAAVCAGVTGALFLCVPRISDIVNTAISIANDGGGGEFFPVVLKVTAVALITEIASDICTGCEMPSLAKAVGAAGKLEIVFISLPLITALYDCAVSFLREL